MIERIARQWVLALALASAGAAGMLLPAVRAEEPVASAKFREHDHDRAQRARDRGEIRPLEEIIPIVRARFPGEVAQIELEQDHGAWIYEFKIIDEAARLVEIKINAATGSLVEVEGE